jgi:hypothetical protein
VIRATVVADHAAICASHVGPCWCAPPPLWPTDQARWERFCLEINSRIMDTRRRQGRDDIGTFSPPIPADVTVRALPVGRVGVAPGERVPFRRFA